MIKLLYANIVLTYDIDMTKSLTTKEFIEKANQKHGNLYDYSKVHYENNKSKIEIICFKHGVFVQEAKAHLKGNGCRNCVFDNIKLTTKEFIKRSKEIHGDLYDYSLVEYENMWTEVKIICSIHGQFLQKPNIHLSKSGCYDCSILSIKKKLTLTTKEFIKRAKKIHGDQYDYSLVDYKDSRTKIKIICFIHGIFEQEPSSHLQKCGCFHCSVNNKKWTTEKFIEKANEIHKNKYDYSKSEYVDNSSKVKIICPEHGVFEQTPHHHLNDQGCYFCSLVIKSNKLKWTTGKFIEEAQKIHKELYDYSLVEYINNHTKIKITCKNHGIFEQKPSSHLSGQGCSNCSENKQLTTKTFIEKAKEVHGEKYDYSLVEYVNNHTKVQIKCNNCENNFYQMPYAHLQKAGCPECSGGSISKKEIEFLDFVGIPQNCRQQDIIINKKKYRVDGYIEFYNLKIVIKLLGNYWHGNPDIFDSNKINSHNEKLFGELYQETIDRLKLFRENGYKVICIWENEWKNLLKFNKQFP